VATGEQPGPRHCAAQCLPDASDNIVGIDIHHASQKLDLKTLETVSIPALTTHLS
jgi:hypothetical protein